MKIYDTALKQIVEFAPPKNVRIYTCGITPYDAAHLGHIFTFMTYDLMQRCLEDQGHSVQLVRNVTDVDEPIFAKAQEIGIPYTELADQETHAFQEILQVLHFRPALAEPRASDYIADMAAAVAQLVVSGFAYRLENDIYFDTSRYPAFGSFSGYSHRLQIAFMRQRGGDPQRPGKRQPLDFLLWRGVVDERDPAAWESPVGRGRPGWHIECSVMSDNLLGIPFDLHGGGSDLIFPHHECEIAQSYGLGQPVVANHWMHVAPISFLGEKMSKSLGNLVFAKDLLARYEPAVIRLALMQYHYRTGGEWIPALLDEAERMLERIRTAKLQISLETAKRVHARVQAALADDIDTHTICHTLEDVVEASQHESGHDDGSELLDATLELLGLQ